MKFIYVMIICAVLSMNTAQANSIDVAGADIRQVMTAIAAGGNLNLVLDDTVKGSVSVKLADLAPQEMIRIIAQSNNYTYDVRNGIIYISRDSSQKTLQSIRINYLDLEKAAQMVNLLLEKGVLSNSDKKDGKKADDFNQKVIIDKDENTLTFYATNEEYNKVRDFIRRNDTAPRQVSLEAKVTVVQNDAA